MSQNWMNNTPNGVPLPGSTPVARNEFDAKLLGQRSKARTPAAEYPDGYLGTIKSRRQERLEKERGRNSLNQRAYQRGVHKGTRVEPSDYFWPDEFNPMTGLQFEAQGLKWAPSMITVPLLTNDGKPAPRGSESVVEPDPWRIEHLKSMSPMWR